MGPHASIRVFIAVAADEFVFHGRWIWLRDWIEDHIFTG